MNPEQPGTSHDLPVEPKSPPRETSAEEPKQETAGTETLRGSNRKRPSGVENWWSHGIVKKRAKRTIAKEVEKGVKRHLASAEAGNSCDTVTPEGPTRSAKCSKTADVDDNSSLGAVGTDKSSTEDEAENTKEETNASVEDTESEGLNANKKELIQKLEMEMKELQKKISEQEQNIRKSEDVATKQMHQNILDGLVEEIVDKLWQKFELQEF